MQDKTIHIALSGQLVGVTVPADIDLQLLACIVSGMHQGAIDYQVLRNAARTTPKPKINIVSSTIETKP